MTDQAGESRVGLRLTLGCELGAVRPAVSRACDFLVTQGLGPDEVSACELVLVEACNNAIEHAEESLRGLPVVIEVDCGDEEVELRVWDHTAGFAWPRVVELPPDDSEDGRGLYLIQSLVDDADYVRGSKANCLVVRRRTRGALEGGGLAMEAGELGRRLAESERIISDMADELSSCYESLSAIFRHSGEQGGSVGVRDFCRNLLVDLLRVTGNTWYVFRWVGVGTSQLAVFASSEGMESWEALELGGGRGSGVEVEAVLE
jgi:anti-sigma regulatory factor (Ser/Thr protein kinase)